MVVFNTFSVPEDGIVHQQCNTRAYMNDKEIGTGTLYITETAVSWCEGTKRLGFSLQYPNISLHAVRREPFPALYLMVDHLLTLPEGLVPADAAQGGGDTSSDGDEDGEEEEGQALSELMFAPQEAAMLERMYVAMTQCQALHPDPDDDGDSDIYEDASEIMDDDEFEPAMQPMDEAEEHMQGLSLGGQEDYTSHNHNGADYDSEQFADY